MSVVVTGPAIDHVICANIVIYYYITNFKAYMFIIIFKNNSLPLVSYVSYFILLRNIPRKGREYNELLNGQAINVLRTLGLRFGRKSGQLWSTGKALDARRGSSGLCSVGTRGY